MKRLTLLASVLLTISATSVQAQSVICEKFGAGQIIANRVCPLGYVKKGEVADDEWRWFRKRIGSAADAHDHVQPQRCC